GKLSDVVIGDLEKWIALGAPDPRDEKPAKTVGIDFEAAKKHWAYQPIRKPALPALKNATPATSPVDHFILAKLEAQGLTLSPPADPRTLLRRVHFDLIGLPPTIEEVEEFVAALDAASDRRQTTSVPSTEYSVPSSVLSTRYSALERVVDRLLNSPQ